MYLLKQVYCRNILVLSSQVVSVVQKCHQRLRYWLNPNPTLNEPHNDIQEILMAFLDINAGSCAFIVLEFNKWSQYLKI